MSCDKLSGTELAPVIVEGGLALICTYDSGKYPICPFLFRPWVERNVALIRIQKCLLYVRKTEPHSFFHSKFLIIQPNSHLPYTNPLRLFPSLQPLRIQQWKVHRQRLRCNHIIQQLKLVC